VAGYCYEYCRIFNCSITLFPKNKTDKTTIIPLRGGDSGLLKKMPYHRINIPNPSGDSMGASLRSLLDVLEQWNTINDKTDVLIDLKKVLFLHPYFIVAARKLTEIKNLKC
jgi:hypothetical protein